MNEKLSGATGSVAWLSSCQVSLASAGFSQETGKSAGAGMGWPGAAACISVLDMETSSNLNCWSQYTVQARAQASVTHLIASPNWLTYFERGCTLKAEVLLLYQAVLNRVAYGGIAGFDTEFPVNGAEVGFDG